MAMRFHNLEIAHADCPSLKFEGSVHREEVFCKLTARAAIVRCRFAVAHISDLCAEANWHVQVAHNAVSGKVSA